MPRNRNNGLRKRCSCPRTKWAKCSHPWHLNYKWKETHYRLSLDREVGQPVTSKSEASREAERIRTAIREGTFRQQMSEALADSPTLLTFATFAERWKMERGAQLVGAKDNAYRLETIGAFVLLGESPALTFGEKALSDISSDDIEAFRASRKAEGLSAVTVNHDLKLLRKMFNWAIRKKLLTQTPFRIDGATVVSLEREIPRAVRFEDADDEDRLLKAANPHLRALIIGLLDTACRPGELLSLQWKDVNLPRREVMIRAEKAKTRTARIVPLSTRLLATLELRKLGPDGKEHPPEAYVFGNDVGERTKSVRTAWINAAGKAGLPGLQLRDLRHEAGSRFDEAGIPINYVSKMLGHTNLTTTTRYLNVQRRELHRAMEKLETHQAAVAQRLHTDSEEAQANVPASEEPVPPKPLIS